MGRLKPILIDGPSPLDAARGFRLLGENGLTHRNPLVRWAGARSLAWIFGETTGNLEAALGISAPGRANGRRAFLNEYRNEEIRALRHLPQFAGLSTFAATKAIHAEWHKYETRSWPRDQLSGHVPEVEPFSTFAYFLAAGQSAPKAETVRGILREIGK